MKGKGLKRVKPNTQLNWTPECQQNFAKLKGLFTTDPVLSRPDKNQKFIVQVDASDVTMEGATLMEGVINTCIPVAHVSKKFSEIERNWVVWDKEAAAVKSVHSTWCH